MSLLRCLLLVLVASLVGCDRGSVNPVPADAESPDFDAKRILERVAQTGKLSGDYTEMPNVIEQIRAVDPGRAENLRGEVDELNRLRKPEDIKAKAQASLSGL